MVAQLVELLAAYDPSDTARVTAVHSHLIGLAGGTLLDDHARFRFWVRIRNDDPKTIVPLLTRGYVAHRRYFLRSVLNGDDNQRADPLSEASFNLHIEWMMLLQDAADCVEYCLDEIGEMLLGDDQEVYSVACRMLAGSSCSPFVPKDVVLRALSRWGVCEYPFAFGEALIKASRFDHDLAEALVVAIGEDDNINQAVVTIVAELPIDNETKHTKACQVALNLKGGSAVAALNAIAQIGVVTPSAVAIVKSALANTEWYIRARAAETAGRLGLDPEEIVPRLAALLHDTEGHDFTVQECVIRALGYYGWAAREFLGDLESLRQMFVSEKYEVDDLDDIETAISRIRGT